MAIMARREMLGNGRTSWTMPIVICIAAMRFHPTVAEDWQVRDPAAPNRPDVISGESGSTSESGDVEYAWEGWEGEQETSESRESEREDEEEDEIETDRDSFTPSTATAGRHRFIVESAYSFLDNREVPETHSFPEVLCRYGISDYLELRLGWNYEVGGAPNTVSSGIDDEGGLMEGGVERESQITYGLKVLLTDQDPYLPRSSVIIQAGTPTTGEDTATQLVTTYAWGWRAQNGWHWDSSIRYAYDSSAGDHFNSWAPSTVLKVPFAERWNIHAEYFGIFSDGRLNDSTLHYFSPGIHCLLHRNYELGTRIGWGLNDQSADFFVNTGFGCRY
jgi:hypothetical protein